MIRIYIPVLLVTFFIQSHCLVIEAPEAFIRQHTKARFGIDYGNMTISGIVEIVQPEDACSQITNRMNGKIGLAIRGGYPSCSFATKVKMVSSCPFDMIFIL